MLKLILILNTNIKFIYRYTYLLVRKENNDQIIKELCIKATTISDTNLL